MAFILEYRGVFRTTPGPDPSPLHVTRLPRALGAAALLRSVEAAACRARTQRCSSRTITEKRGTAGWGYSFSPLRAVRLISGGGDASMYYRCNLVLKANHIYLHFLSRGAPVRFGVRQQRCYHSSTRRSKAFSVRTGSRRASREMSRRTPEIRFRIAQTYRASAFDWGNMCSGEVTARRLGPLGREPEWRSGPAPSGGAAG